MESSRVGATGNGQCCAGVVVQDGPRPMEYPTEGGRGAPSNGKAPFPIPLHCVVYTSISHFLLRNKDALVFATQETLKGAISLVPAATLFAGCAYKTKNWRANWYDP